MLNIGGKESKSDLGYVSTITRYQAQNCTGCTLRSLCHKAQKKRIIEVNHKLNEYRRKARERLLSADGVYHRGRRCIEPEAVFAQIKCNSNWNRFRLKGLKKVNIEFTLVAIAHNLRKLAKKISFYLVWKLPMLVCIKFEQYTRLCIKRKMKCTIKSGELRSSTKKRRHPFGTPPFFFLVLV